MTSAILPAVRPAVDALDARLRLVVDLHYDALWRFVRRLGVPEGQVEDATQQVLLVFARRAADVDEDAEIAQTEVFGPVLTVVRYDGDDDEAARVANNSRYGLSAYIQTQDPERAWRLAHRMKAGTVNIGPSFYLSPDTPFGGYGISGVGREHGEDGFREYLQAKTIATPAVPA